MSKEQFEIYKKQLDEFLHADNKLAVWLGRVEEKTKIKRLYLFSGVTFAFLVYLLVWYGGHLITNMIGFLLPAYSSFKAIESPNKDDDTIWLIYWVVYSSFTFAEFFADFIFVWLPFYWLAKLVFLLWLMYPGEYNGSIIFYYKVIRPFVLCYEHEIDKRLDRMKSIAKDVVGEASQALDADVKEQLQTSVHGAIGKQATDIFADAAADYSIVDNVNSEHDKKA